MIVRGATWHGARFRATNWCALFDGSTWTYRPPHDTHCPTDAAMPGLTDAARLFCERSRVARLATADATGVPHLVPVCYAIIGDSLYITIDEKPKRTDIPLKRLRNIAENPEVAVTIDRWDEDWRRLAWVMLHGRAEILTDGEEHDRAQARLRERYPQYRAMDLAPLPVIALRIARAAAWGDLND